MVCPLRCLGLLLILCIQGNLDAQQVDTLHVTFHVSGSSSGYRILPKDSVLWGGQSNLLEIVALGKKKEVFVNLQGGNLAPVPGNDSLFSATVNDTVVQALLTISEKTPSGKTRLLLSKPYRVKRIPPPVVYVCGVKSDSVIDRMQLIQDDFVYARSPRFKTKLLITSFDIVFVNGSSSQVLHSASNRFTVDQRREMYKLQSGNIIYFQNIRCELPSGETLSLAPVQIYVTETNKYKVGDRKITK